MRVKQLKMNGFRGIGDLTLEFPEDQPIVFIGDNGVGKSSILDCLAIFLSHLMRMVRTPKDFIPPVLSEEDITNGQNETLNEVIVSVNGLGDLPLTIDFKRELFPNNIDSNSNNDYGKAFSKFIYDQIRTNPKASLPLAVYYPTDRTIFEIAEENLKDYPFVQINAYDRAIVGEKIDFKDFFNWFRQQEDLENELRLDDNPDYREPRLEAVRQAISSLMPEFSNLRVRRSPLRMTVKKQDQELILNQLSDGEKCLLAMVGDLARRLAIANPGLDKPLEGSGVVLIDEIELHLHPKWQRKIIPALTRTFPNCQFIVTTHSPQVVSHVKPEGVYSLKATPNGIIALHPEISYGRDSNQILETVMDDTERPPEIQKQLLELFRLIDKGDLEGAKKLRQQIADEIKGSEPELIKAGTSIRRREILKR